MTTVVGAWPGFAPGRAPLPGATPAAAAAVLELCDTFAGHALLARPTPEGGAFVVVDGVALGGAWIQTTTWVGLVVSHLHPAADCYPHWVRPDLARTDGGALVSPFHAGNAFADQPAVMVSRASRRRDPLVDTPALKTLSVIDFVRGAR